MPFYPDKITTIKAKLGIDEGGPVHAFFTDTCAKAMDKYVPFDTGALAETVILANGSINRANITTHSITYNQEYASIVYEGITHGKEMNFHKDKHRLATSYWDIHMWTAEQDRIVRQVQKELDRRGGK